MWGMERLRSIIKFITLSRYLLPKDKKRAKTLATRRAERDPIKPIFMEVARPLIVLKYISLPVWSVPKMWERLGPCNLFAKSIDRSPSLIIAPLIKIKATNNMARPISIKVFFLRLIGDFPINFLFIGPS